MRIVTVKLKSNSPYSQSKAISPISMEKRPGEDSNAVEIRTWRERIHVGPAGTVIIPGMALKWSLESGARRRSDKTKGKGTYTKHFAQGIMVIEDLDTGIPATSVTGDWLFLHANGKRGPGTRVMRCMPRLQSWEGIATYTILDDAIPPKIFEQTLADAGAFIGVGRFRPENSGTFGRYIIDGNLTWRDV